MNKWGKIIVIDAFLVKKKCVDRWFGTTEEE